MFTAALAEGLISRRALSPSPIPPSLETPLRSTILERGL